MKLYDLIIQRAQQTPDALAVKGPDTSLTYAALDCLANAFAYALAARGVQRGDRIGIWLEKSASTVAAMQGILRLQAIYVPLDPLSPVARVCTILQDCDIHVLVTTRLRADLIMAAQPQPVACLCLDTDWSSIVSGSSPLLPGLESCIAETEEHEIAYILYTSGSTGKPKGVCISNRNALAFIEWAADVLDASPADRFSNHAPFHFDLSVLDLYVAFFAGAMVVLISDGIAYLPGSLIHCLVQEGLTVWYSVPSVLILMMEHGALLSYSALALRALLFAGEPFSIKHLRKLYQHWPQVRFLNLYGPTETNVCTSYEVTEIADHQTRPVPIGKACSGDSVWARKDDGSVAGPGEEGELIVAGPTVMIGYWGQPVQGMRPYATGDLVRLQEDGNYVYLGRRDHLVKVRGYRIELGDIDAALEAHPGISEAATLVLGKDIHARLVTFFVPRNANIPSLLEIKKYCAARLPRYMIVDEIHAISTLPRTRNGKIDRLTLSHSISC